MPASTTASITARFQLNALVKSRKKRNHTISRANSVAPDRNAAPSSSPCPGTDGNRDAAFGPLRGGLSSI